MPDAEDVGTVLGCLGCAGIILLKIGAIIAVAWIVAHFALKYW